MRRMMISLDLVLGAVKLQGRWVVMTTRHRLRWTLDLNRFRRLESVFICLAAMMIPQNIHGERRTYTPIYNTRG